MTQMENGSMRWAAVVLAAGKGSRMKTALHKALHKVGGKRMIDRVLEAVADAGITDTTIVRDLSPSLPDALGLIYRYVTQPTPNGTGGALKALLESNPPDADSLLILNADLPLITPECLTALQYAHDSTDAVLTLLTFDAPANSDAGRVVRSPGGAIQAIIETTDPGYADAPTEANAGVYAFRTEWVRSVLPRLPLQENGEYYITDLVAMAVADGHPVQAIALGSSDEAIGVNTLVDLAKAEQVARRRALEALMLSGVTIQDPATTYIDDTVSIAPNTVICPNTHIYGKSVISAECEIGPDSHITDSVIGERCSVRASWLDGVTLENGVSVGPFARLRPETHIGEDTHIGSFGEIKASRLGRRTAMGHFGYVGDSEIGDDVNIGAGAVTCNYDGVDKHHTMIGDRAFIGSGSMLVAPVEIGSNAYTAAGSVVTKNVAAGTTVAGVPAKPIRR